MAKKSTTPPVVTRSALFPGNVTRELRVISPHQASAWLGLTTRPVDLRKAEMFSREILSGRHKPTGRNDIVFYDDGTLAFGQDELRGIILANRNHTMFVTSGVRRADVEIDCMSANEYFSRIGGVRYASSVVAAIRGVLLDRATGGAVITTRPSRIRRFSNTEIWEEYVRNRALYDSAVLFALTVNSRSGRLLRVSEVAAHYVYAMVDLGCAVADLTTFYDTLIDSITTGTPIPSNDFMGRLQADDILRSQLMATVFRKGYFTECWNMWRSGISTTRLSYTPTTHPGLRKI